EVLGQAGGAGVAAAAAALDGGVDDGTRAELVACQQRADAQGERPFGGRGALDTERQPGVAGAQPERHRPAEGPAATPFEAAAHLPRVRRGGRSIEPVGGGAPARPARTRAGHRAGGALAAGAAGELERQVDADALRRALLGLAAELAGPGDGGPDPGDRQG